LNIKKELFKGSLIVSIITLIGHVLSTGLKVYVSRKFGLQIFGVFSLIHVFSRFLVSIIQLGYNHSMVYFVSKYKVQNEWGKISNVFNKGLYGIILAWITLALILFAFKTYFTNYFFQDYENNVIPHLIFLILVLAIINYTSAVLKGLKKIKEQTIISTSFYPAVMIFSLFLVTNQSESESLEDFLFLGISINLIALSIMFLIIKFKLKKKNVFKNKNYSINISEYSVPIWLSSLLVNGIGKADRIMLGLLMTVDEVGIYNAGLTLSIIFAFPLRSLKPILDPLIVGRYINNDFKSLNILFNTMIRWTSLFVVPMFGFLVCFGVNIIQLFGRDFVSGYTVMLVLSISQMISTVFGVATSILNMGDRPKLNLKIMVFGAIITILLNMLLIPKWGGLGAAIGTSIALAFIKLIQIKAVTTHFKITPNYSSLLKLIIIFALIVVVFLKLIFLATVSWLYLAFGYMFFSCAIIYLILKKSERSAIRSLLKNKY
jgi:O-antigen/teichoic acid export membrane protein